MRSKNYRLASSSFKDKILKDYFITSIIIKAFYTVLLISNFIFFEYFNINFHLLSLVLSFCGIVIFLKTNKQELFWCGFFIGIIWFYWISFSFIYYGFWFMLPFGIIGIGLFYGFLFSIIGFYNENIYLKTILFYLLNFIHPFGFNWLDLRLILINSPLNANFISLAFFLLSAIIFIKIKTNFKLIIICLIFFFNLDNYHKEINFLPFDIKMIQTNINQFDKWKEENIQLQIQNNINEIQKAIKEKKELIIFPESAFPLLLNQEKSINNKLKNLSNEISIITGALSFEDNKFYNSTYIFTQGKMQILHKVILVPFGEGIPLPSFIKDFINKIFYNDAVDFSVSHFVSDYEIKNIKIRNAICFEATREELFLGSPNFMIALSNNAWFTPSTQSTMQNSLLKLYATLHQTTIYHVSNHSKNKIITPKNGGNLGKIKDYFLSF